jgi:phospholipid N-methyltransferase
MTRLEKPLKREITINDELYVVTIGPTDLKITRKGHRKGIELQWLDLISGDTALATALNASVNDTEERT